MLDPAAPQLVVNSRFLHVGWLPADPDAVSALVPAGLRPYPDRRVFLGQCVVDDACQTSGLGAYDLTYLGASLDGVDAPGGATPGGWWTHYITSTERVLGYVRMRGFPAYPGSTTIDVRADTLVAETEMDGVPVIRIRCRVGETGHVIDSGQSRYFTRRDGQLLSSIYPYLVEPVSPFEVESIEFLEPEHPTYALRPANPLTIVAGFYSPRVAFAYPGGPTVHPGDAGLPDEQAGGALAAATARRPATRVVSRPVSR
ncbi:hypothetical protein [Micromonospora avicenniae]|uniref:Acetoacetate decarboxylase (ADC) n=1 Tax=Micromonospora avicenniae TaxID=1198245 RepID=A0A1N6X714_9ACTN|nr:hypothetical protein [Micromonospora avicenniae]SIQ98057.1 hypothetical protein SAMN05444858_105248 [Micromonospora avicenniae]